MKNGAWLLLIHQLPPKPESLRVKVWRALQKVGALHLKNSVYVLPSGPENQDRFTTIIEEIIEGKGEAFLCTSDFLQGIDREEIVENFNRDRESCYEILAEGLRELQKILSKKNIAEDDLMTVEHSIGKLNRQLTELKEIDFFMCKNQKPTLNLLQSVSTAVDHLKNKNSPRIQTGSKADFQEKTWVTRQDVHIDRIASAWLIQRFIDKKASFKFVKADNYKARKNECRFDMFDAEFTHVGDRCTFEVIVEVFGIKDLAVKTIAEVIHDLDLKDNKFNRPETSGIGLVINGMIKGEASDSGRIEKGFLLFDDIYKSFK